MLVWETAKNEVQAPPSDRREENKDRYRGVCGVASPRGNRVLRYQVGFAFPHIVTAESFAGGRVTSPSGVSAVRWLVEWSGRVSEQTPRPVPAQGTATVCEPSLATCQDGGERLGRAGGGPCTSVPWWP